MLTMHCLSQIDRHHFSSVFGNRSFQTIPGRSLIFFIIYKSFFTIRGDGWIHDNVCEDMGVVVLSVTSLHTSRSRGHRLFRLLDGFCGLVREKRAWIKELGLLLVYGSWWSRAPSTWHTSWRMVAIAFWMLEGLTAMALHRFALQPLSLCKVVKLYKKSLYFWVLTRLGRSNVLKELLASHVGLAFSLKLGELSW